MADHPTYFTDTLNRRWTTTVNLATLRRVKDLTGVDLLSEIQLANLPAFVSDVLRVASVVYAVIKPQTDQAHLSEEQFYEALDDGKLSEAFSALMAGVAFFFPPAQRQILLRILDAIDQQYSRRDQQLASMLPELDRMIQQAEPTPTATAPAPAQ